MVQGLKGSCEYFQGVVDMACFGLRVEGFEDISEFEEGRKILAAYLDDLAVGSDSIQ